MIHTVRTASGSKSQVTAAEAEGRGAKGQMGRGAEGPKLILTGYSGVGLALTPGGRESICDAEE